MKFILCIPVDLDIPNTSRATIKTAGKRLLVDLARDPEGASKLLREAADTEMFLVRSPTEPMYGERTK